MVLGLIIASPSCSSFVRFMHILLRPKAFDNLASKLHDDVPAEKPGPRFGQ